ncbi:MAG: spore cortex biosynthesis protein YabQ [Eubacteriales bacterium]|nr:spore cortex biosynthesis protein YabQ [Eubacteriales bacterium]
MAVCSADMLFSTVPQPWIFLFTLYGGIVLGFFYDVLRLMRRALHSRPWLDAVFDVVFWAVGTVFVFAVLWKICQGEVRYYCLLGFAAGCTVYMLGMSRLLLAGADALQKGVKKVAARLAATKLGQFVKR